MRISDWSSDVCSSDLYNQTDDLNFVSGYFGGYPWHYLTADALVSIAGTLESRLTNFAPLFDEFLTNCKDSVLEMEVATLYHVKKAIQPGRKFPEVRSEEHTSELQSLMRISYAVFCLKKKTKRYNTD